LRLELLHRSHPRLIILDLLHATYSSFSSKERDGDSEHSFPHSLVDQRGILRSSISLVRLDTEEFRLISSTDERA